MDFTNVPSTSRQPVLHHTIVTNSYHISDNKASKLDLLDRKKIFVKNLPKDFKKSEIIEFLTMFGPYEVIPFGKNAAFAKFHSEQQTKEVLEFLHQQQINNYILNVEYGKLKPVTMPTTTTSMGFQKVELDDDDDDDKNLNKIVEKLNNVIKILNATNLEYNSDSLATTPPDIHYVYPKANRDIIDAISISLETTPKFYTQVLHLMNRMNMEPPFVLGSKSLQFPDGAAATYHTIASQTELSGNDLCTNPNHKRMDELMKNDGGWDLASNESEMESNSDSNNDDPRKFRQLKKRKLLDKPIENRQQNVKRFRSIIDFEKTKESTKHQQQTNRVNVEHVFESNPILNRQIKIVQPLVIQETITTVEDTENLIGETTEKIDTDEKQIRLLTDTELLENRLPKNQMESNPLFQNYQMGERSNKLYIKNLAKTVTEDDLRQIYWRYKRKSITTRTLEEANANATDVNDEIEIRLMKSGRMKGQAFITFNQPYLDDDNYKIVQQALDETNGFILKDKIMIVAFGKK